MSRIKSLIIKELIAVWQDKKSRIILILPPIIQFCIFAFAATLEVDNVSLAILDKDRNPSSRDFIQHLEGAQLFHHIRYIGKESEIAPLLDTQRALMVLVIDPNFSRDILSGRTAQLQVLTDGRRSNSAQIALGYIQDIALRYGASLSPPPSYGVEVIPRFLYNPNLYYPWFTVSGLIGILAMLTSLGVSTLSIAREKETGTMDQLLVTPMTTTEILIGKALPAIVIGVCEGLFMMLLGITLLGLPVSGSILMLILSLAVFILAIVGVGLFISSIAQTQQQATLGLFLMMVPTVTVSGFATPVENMPIWLQYFSVANPLKYFLVISRGICIKDMDTLAVLNTLWPMIVIASVTLTASNWLFRRKML